MARITELVGWGFAVQPIEIPDVDPKDGQPRHNGNGQLKTKAGKMLVRIDPAGEQIRVALSQEAAAKLAAELNGGIEIPRSRVLL